MRAGDGNGRPVNDCVWVDFRHHIEDTTRACQVECPVIGIVAFVLGSVLVETDHVVCFGKPVQYPRAGGTYPSGNNDVHTVSAWASVQNVSVSRASRSTE
jgi:hypothetical protein